MTLEYPKINISDVHRKVIYEAFPVSRQTVNDALKYHNNSETAKSIRTMARNLLKKELDNVNALLKEENL